MDQQRLMPLLQPFSPRNSLHWHSHFLRDLQMVMLDGISSKLKGHLRMGVWHGILFEEPNPTGSRPSDLIGLCGTEFMADKMMILSQMYMRERE